ncbi:hypothetical protein BZA05DRAFT_395443 [Tricharina praecox]|uniref:uncharacterized protein n=1 Tax=Tricharina praecox TaxID=43433 RepID=UPI00221E3D9A|nr:uncharacterized protein BZA05DRAFT_395443 [Tricharina praecox]KAI5854025.1 hypothetical protein BZA05DRAFT_395443 [Tricharina praecox]
MDGARGVCDGRWKKLLLVRGWGAFVCLFVCLSLCLLVCRPSMSLRSVRGSECFAMGLFFQFSVILLSACTLLAERGLRYEFI